MLRSLVFKEHEGSYCRDHGCACFEDWRIGFLGGMDIGLIHRFKEGYEEGAKSVNPNIRVIPNYVGGLTQRGTIRAKEKNWR